MKRIQALSLILLAVIIGCDQTQPPTTPVPPEFSEDLSINATATNQIIEFQGVRFETPPSDDNPNDTDVNGSNVSFKWGGIRGQLKAGALTVEDNWYGPLRRGDIVTLGDDGTVRINGQRRDVTSPSNFSTNGIQFSFSGQHGNVSMSNNEGEFTDMFGRKCELRGGVFFVDGRNMGPVQKGDKVMLAADGSVQVNDEARSPQ